VEEVGIAVASSAEPIEVMPSSSSNAGSVDVQAPPGLEAMSGCHGLSPHLSSPGFSEGMGSPVLAPSVGPIAPPKAERVKEELVREVTAAVRDHIEYKTAAAVDSLWQKGQRAMQHLQQQQLNQTQLLQSQLAACAEAHQQLQRENAMLRSGLEALMKHLTLVFGPPPNMSYVLPTGATPPIVPPSLSPPESTPIASTTAAPPTSPTQFVSPEDLPLAQTPIQADEAGSESVAPVARSTPEACNEDFHTPAGSPNQAEVDADDTTSSPLAGIPGFPLGTSGCGGTGSQFEQFHSPQPHAIMPSTAPPPAPLDQTPEVATFSLTLRRADNVPLGLEVAGDSGQDHLIVEAVRLGGAVEAWNRQCHGDEREIRRGDRIIMINGAKDADSMREECKKKHLLKMSVVRGPVEQCNSDGSDTSAAVAASMYGGLRAEANEFVPQARPWVA